MAIERLQVRMSSPRALPVEDRPGLVLVGVRRSTKEVPLIFIKDEGPLNTGCSATNALPALLMWLQSRWPDFPVRAAVVVEQDSQDCFDHAYPEWSSDYPNMEPLVVWKPLRWPGEQPRSQEAFEGLFGQSARAALHAALYQRG